MTGEICGTCPVRYYCEEREATIAADRKTLDETRLAEDPTLPRDSVTVEHLKIAQLALGFEVKPDTENLPKILEHNLANVELGLLGLSKVQIARMRFNLKGLPVLIKRREAQERIDKTNEVLAPYRPLLHRLYCDLGFDEDILPSGEAEYFCNHPELDPIQRYATRLRKSKKD